MDFGIYPPEINSGRMYTGPGLGPMLAAAQAWDGLADELYVAASSYQSVVLSLTAGTWSGPSSASMAAAAAPYVTWLHTTATQAEQTAGQAKAAIAAYEAAFASTVPPPVVAANRSLLMMLVATNILGQNTPAIAATEFHYAEMWAQDAAAMYGYAASSAAATALSPFTSPPQSTNPGGPVGQAAGTSVGNVQSTISAASQAISAAPAVAPAQADPLTALSNLITVFLTAPTDLATIYGIIPMDVLSGPVDFPIAYLGTIAGLRTDDTVSGWVGIEGWPGTGTVAPTDFPAIITSPGPIAASSPTVSAAVGEANTIGALSVPQGWAVAAPAIRPVALTSPIPGVTAAATVETLEFGSGSMLSQTGLAGMIGPTLANTVSTDVARDGRRREMTGKRSAADGKDQVAQCKPRAVVTGVAARLRHLATLRDEGRISGEEFTAQKKRLLGR